jgi:hypothetical protein
MDRGGPVPLPVLPYDHLELLQIGRQRRADRRFDVHFRIVSRYDDADAHAVTHESSPLLPVQKSAAAIRYVSQRLSAEVAYARRYERTASHRCRRRRCC